MSFKEDNLWLELTKIDNIVKRRSLIFDDVKSGRKRFEVLAENDPFRFFELLGGDESSAIRYDWAFEYTYNDYIDSNGLEYDENDADNWDLEEESIKNAYDYGYWHVTGIVILDGLKGEKLFFDLQYTQGHCDGIIGTPYNTDDNLKEHGILLN
jgi:hypothetical protein